MPSRPTRTPGGEPAPGDVLTIKALAADQPHGFAQPKTAVAARDLESAIGWAAAIAAG